MSFWYGGVTYSQGDLDKNKEELNPKRRPQHAMLTEF